MTETDRDFPRVLGPETAKLVALMAAIIQAPSLAVHPEDCVSRALEILIEVNNYVRADAQTDLSP